MKSRSDKQCVVCCARYRNQRLVGAVLSRYLLLDKIWLAPYNILLLMVINLADLSVVVIL